MQCKTLPRVAVGNAERENQRFRFISNLAKYKIQIQYYVRMSAVSATITVGQSSNRGLLLCVNLRQKNQ
jgi:hypothetical protein